MVKQIFIGSKLVGELEVPNIPYSKKKLPFVFQNWPISQRISALCTYLKMCGNREELEADNFILNFPHVFSLNRNYQDWEPYGLIFNGERYARNSRLSAYSFDDYVYLQCFHSYSGENDRAVIWGIENGVDALREKILTDKEMKVVNTSLFQQYWTVGTNCREFLANEVYYKIAPHYAKMLKRGNWSIMEGAMTAYSWMGKNTSQNRLKYATKDAWLDFSLIYPEYVDPESFLEAGPGCQLGLYQIFEEKPRNHEIQQAMYETIMSHSEYPLTMNHYSRLEAQICYFIKYFLMKNGFIDATKRNKR